MTSFGITPEGYIACDILTEIQHRLSGGSSDLPGSKTLFFYYRHIVGGGGGDFVMGLFCFAVIRRLAIGIHDLAVFIVGKPDGAIVAPIPAFIGKDRLYTSVGFGDLQLC